MREGVQEGVQEGGSTGGREYRRKYRREGTAHRLPCPDWKGVRGSGVGTGSGACIPAAYARGRCRRARWRLGACRSASAWSLAMRAVPAGPVCGGGWGDAIYNRTLTTTIIT